ncbi:MAG: ribonuclease III [Deltaproteobacteria bacterium]|nr:ribonuclease III [Deltaproteobacteria bacterium]
MIELLQQLITEQTPRLIELQNILGHKFNKTKLLLRALTHRSFTYEHPELPKNDNETLEFLGDAVIDLAVGFMLFNHYPRRAEGDLTKIRSALVQESGLALVARRLNLGKYLLLGKGEDNSGGRQKDSLLSCTYEAVIGAIFVDAGYEKTAVIIHNHFADRLEIGRDTGKITDAKSSLQELTQGEHGLTPAYVLEKSQGPDHDKTFTIAVELNGKKIAAASAKSKKAAEQKAAALALEHLAKHK